MLYVSGSSQYAHTAIRNCAQLLARFDRTRIRFEVCDVSRDPDRAEADAVCYTPMPVKRSPAPRTCLVGDLSSGDALIDLLESNGLTRA